MIIRQLVQLIFKCLLVIAAISTFLLMAVMLGHLLSESRLSISRVGLDLLNPQKDWRPLGSTPSYGIVNILAGTLCVTGLSVVLSVIFGTGTALFLAYYFPAAAARIILSVIELIAGIPSVIFGFFGLSVVVKWFESHLQMASGECVLAASLILTLMLLPFVVSTMTESIRAFREVYEPTSIALGLSREYFIVKLLLPRLRLPLLTAVMLAFGRGLGETMAVMMVIGNSPAWPRLFGRAETIASLTALEMGGVEYGSLHLSSLYFANVMLLALVLSVFGAGYFLKRRYSHEQLAR